jgi:hypothetical protein
MLIAKFLREMKSSEFLPSEISCTLYNLYSLRYIVAEGLGSQLPIPDRSHFIGFRCEIPSTCPRCSTVNVVMMLGCVRLDGLMQSYSGLPVYCHE